MIRDLQARSAWSKRLAKPVQRPRGSLVWGKGARILLLINRDDPTELADARAFAKTHRAKGVDVRELTFTAQKVATEERSDKAWTPASLSFSGLPTADAESLWRERDYDVVIRCGFQPLAPFDYLAAGLRAHRRVAPYDSALEAYDLIVQPAAGSGVASYLQEVERLMATLNPHYAQ